MTDDARWSFGKKVGHGVVQGATGRSHRCECCCLLKINPRAVVSLREHESTLCLYLQLGDKGRKTRINPSAPIILRSLPHFACQQKSGWCQPVPQKSSVGKYHRWWYAPGRDMQTSILCLLTKGHKSSCRCKQRFVVLNEFFLKYTSKKDKKEM